MPQTNIVIAGAGFGGLQTALALHKRFWGNNNIKIILIDRHDRHLFTPNLFEVATSEEELVSVGQLGSSIGIPISDILAGTNIQFVSGKIQQIDQASKNIVLEHKQVAYDYAVLALGSQSEYFGIPGAKEYSLPLKTFTDALRIRNQIAFVLQQHRQDSIKRTLRIVVAGGGYTGVEFISELAHMADFLAWKYQYPRKKIELEIIEAQNALIPGFSQRLSRDAWERLVTLGVRVRLNTPVAKVDNHFVETVGGERFSYDVLVWTAGVRAANVVFSEEMPQDNKGRLLVNGFLQTFGNDRIFALGDMAAVLDRSYKKTVPASAQEAWSQARFLASALPVVLNNKRPKSYEPRPYGFIVSMGGKWAIMDYKYLYIQGLLAYAADRYAHLRYYTALLGFWRAVKYLFLETKTFSKNDL